jgi:hypothetical protein
MSSTFGCGRGSRRRTTPAFPRRTERSRRPRDADRPSDSETARIVSMQRDRRARSRHREMVVVEVTSIGMTSLQAPTSSRAATIPQRHSDRSRQRIVSSACGSASAPRGSRSWRPAVDHGRELVDHHEIAALEHVTREIHAEFFAGRQHAYGFIHDGMVLKPTAEQISATCSIVNFLSKSSMTEPPSTR